MAKDDGSIAGVSKDELAGLSEEERAALAESESQDQGDAAALKEIAGEGGDGAGDEGGNADNAGDGDEQKGGAAPGGDTTQGADTVQGAGADDAGDDEHTEAVAPRYVAPPVKDYANQVAAINTEESKLLADYKAGEIEDAEFSTKKADIQNRRDDLLTRKLKGEFSTEFNQQMAAQQWQLEINHFMRQAKREGLDYNAPENKELKAALDRTVKVLGHDPANSDKDGEWFLAEAHEIVKARFKRTAAGDDAGNAGGKGAGEAAGTKPPPSRKPDLKSVPQTLGGLPAATETGTDVTDPEFVGLDKLEGLEFENAIARLTPAQQDRYARSR